TILLRAEQGAGDTIQFIRYAPQIAERGGQVVVRCPANLVSLFRRSMPQIRFVAETEPASPFDAHCPIMSLPRAFRTRLDSIPATVPYLKADPAKIASFRALCTSDALNIGIAWAGKADHIHDRFRSTTLDTFAPLSHIPGVRLFSLQKG